MSLWWLTRRARLCPLAVLPGFILLAWAAVSTQATTLNASHDLVPFGIAGTNMIPDQPGQDARPLLSAAIEYAKAHGITVLTADRGAYYFKTLQFSDRHLQISDANNLTIDLDGSDIFLSHTNYLGIVLDHSTNAVLQNFTVDYVDLPFTQVHADAVDAPNRRIQFSVQPGWRDPSVFNTSISPYGLPDAVHAFVFRDGQPVFDVSRLDVDRPVAGNQFTISNQGFPWTTADVLARIQPGDTVVLTLRGGGDAMHSNECSSCTFRNIKIYSSGVNGIVLTESTASVVERVYVMPRPGTDRLMSSNADGITLSQPRAGNTIRLSRAIRTADDGFSPHSLLLGTVTSQTGPRQLVVQRQYANRIFNGSPVAFERPSDGVMLGAAVVASQTPSPAQWVFGGSITMDFAADLPPNIIGAVVFTTDPSQRGTNTVLERSTVQDQVFARGITLWGLVNSSVHGNYVRRAQMAAVLGTHRVFPVDWMSPPLSNVSITGNVIDGANRFGAGILEKMAGIELLAQKDDFQPMLVSPHQNIEVSGNFIAEPARSAVRLQNVTTGSVSGNYLLNPSDRPFFDGYWEDTFEPYRTEFKTPVVVTTSAGVSNVNNSVDTTNARLFVSDIQSRRLAAYAPGSVVRFNGYGIGQPPPQQLTIVDANGTIRPMDVTSVAGHYVEAQLPPATALGAGVVTATLGAKKWIGTLFLDSADNVPAVNGCSYLVSPESTTVSRLSTALRILVATQPGCGYGVRSFDANVGVGGHSSGTGVVQLSVLGSPRPFAVEVAGEYLSLTKSGFTDVPIYAGVTTIKAEHFIELHQRIAAVRARFGLPAYPIDPNVLAGAMVKVQHIVALRNALAEAYTAANRITPVYTDPTLHAGEVVKAAHILELRAAVTAME